MTVTVDSPAEEDVAEATELEVVEDSTTVTVTTGGNPEPDGVTTGIVSVVDEDLAVLVKIVISVTVCERGAETLVMFGMTDEAPANDEQEEEPKEEPDVEWGGERTTDEEFAVWGTGRTPAVAEAEHEVLGVTVTVTTLGVGEILTVVAVAWSKAVVEEVELATTVVRCSPTEVEQVEVWAAADVCLTMVLEQVDSRTSSLSRSQCCTMLVASCVCLQIRNDGGRGKPHHPHETAETQFQSHCVGTGVCCARRRCGCFWLTG